MVWYLCLVKGGNYPGFVAVLVRVRHIKNGKIGDTRIPVANSSKLIMLFSHSRKRLCTSWIFGFSYTTAIRHMAVFHHILSYYWAYFMFFLILFHHHQTPNRTKASSPICHTLITLNILSDLRSLITYLNWIIYLVICIPFFRLAQLYA